MGSARLRTNKKRVNNSPRWNNPEPRARLRKTERLGFGTTDVHAENRALANAACAFSIEVSPVTPT